MNAIELNKIKNMLVERRQRVQQVVNIPGTKTSYINLLKEIDSALERMDSGTYGICLVCHEPIEDDRLLINPLISVCLGDLNEHQRRSLESDLDLANKMQRAMLPKNNLITPHWEVYFHYEPAGIVSGDYCDIIESGGDKFFILGDVSGKGIAASMMMTHLNAMFRSMIPSGLGVAELVQRASRLMCESTASELYATLLCIKADDHGQLEICNAGHPQPIIINKNEIIKPTANGIPIGLFCDSEYTISKVTLEKNDSLFMYTDGLTESFRGEEEFGVDRVADFILENHVNSPKDITQRLVNEVENYIAGSPKTDDLTMMTIKKL